MLSQSEREYLSKTNQYSKNYQYVLDHRIKSKLKQFYKKELPLIYQNKALTDFYKDLTENHKEKVRTRSDSNRRPNAPQAFALSKLCNESENFGKCALNLDCD